MSERSSAVSKGAARLPANLSGLQAASAQTLSHGISYELACACGSPILSVQAGSSPEGEFLDPVSVSCDRCGAEAMIFDSSRDGYDGRLNGGASYHQSSSRSPVTCPTCGSSSSKLKCDLAYNIDFEEEGDLDLLKIAPDLFDAISISTTCSNGHASQDLGSWEMA